MTLDLELTKDQGSFLFVCTLRKGRFFLYHFLEKLLKSIFNSLMGVYFVFVTFVYGKARSAYRAAGFDICM